METIAFLKRIIGGQKTLIITCMECCLDIEQRITGHVYRYTALGNMVSVDDEYQKQSILSFVEFKGCSKIIIAGHENCRALNYLLHHQSDDDRLNRYKEGLSLILSDSHEHLLSPSNKQRVLVEQNVIAQCRILLGFEQIKEKFADQSLTIIGLVIQSSGLCKQVFSNGISYNNFISMN
jgi:carbonic anhydrase